MSDVVTLPFAGYAWVQKGFKGVFVGDEQIDQDEPLVAVVRLQSKFDLKLVQGVFNVLPAVQAVVTAYEHDTSEPMQALREAMKALHAAADASVAAMQEATNALNAAADAAVVSAASTNTATGEAASQMQEPAGPPVALMPPNGARDVPLRPSFSWDPVQGANRYLFAFVKGDDAGRESSDAERDRMVIVSPGVTVCDGTAFKLHVKLKPNTTYFWHVLPVNARTSDGASTEGPSSAVFSFTTCSGEGSEQ